MDAIDYNLQIVGIVGCFTPELLCGSSMLNIACK